MFVAVTRARGVLGAAVGAVVVPARGPPVAPLFAEAVEQLARPGDLRRARLRGEVAIAEQLGDAHAAKFREHPRQHDVGVRRQPGLLGGARREVADDKPGLLLAYVDVVGHGDRADLPPRRWDERAHDAGVLGRTGEVRDDVVPDRADAARARLEAVRTPRFEALDDHVVHRHRSLVEVDLLQRRAAVGGPEE